jgi:hypothetical protein
VSTGPGVRRGNRRQEYRPLGPVDLAVHRPSPGHHSLGVTAGGTCNRGHAIRVLEWSPLAPRIVVDKLYAPGVGILGEEGLSGLESFEPVEFTPYPR